MDEKILREQVIRAEGYAQGFKEGFIACANFIVDQQKKEVQENTSHT